MYATTTFSVTLVGCATNIVKSKECPLASSSVEGWFLTSVPTAVDGSGSVTVTVSPYGTSAGWWTGIDYWCELRLDSDQGVISFTGTFM